MHFRKRAPKNLQPLGGREIHQANPHRPRPTGRLRRFFLRASVRLTLGVLIIVATLLLLLLYYPISLPWLDRKLEARFNQITGLDLSYAKSSFYLSGGQILFEKPAVTDPATGNELLGVSLITIDLSFWQFIFPSDKREIDSITVNGPVELDIIRTDTGYTLSEPWNHLVDYARNYQWKQERKEGASRVKRFSLKPVRLRLVADGLNQPQPIYAYEDVAVTCDFNEQGRPSVLSLKGQLDDQTAQNHLSLTFRPLWHDQKLQSMHLVADIRNLGVPGGFFTAYPESAEIGDVQLNSTIQAAGPSLWNIDGDLLVSQSAGTQVKGEPAKTNKLSWTMKLDTGIKKLNIDQLVFAGSLGQSDIQGEVSYAAPYDYAVSVKQLHLIGEGIELLAQRLPHRGRMIRPGRGEIKLRADVSGKLNIPRPESLTGELSLKGIDWQLASLPSPITHVQVDASLSTTTLRLIKASGRFEGFPLEMKGRVDGNPLYGEVDSVDIQWTTAGDMQELLELLRTNPKFDKNLEMAGGIAGKGEFKAKGPFKEGLANALEEVQVSGDIQLKDVRLNHPELPKAVRNLNGGFSFTNTEATFKNLTGEIMGISLDLDGQVTGKPFFWRDPQLALKSKVDFDVDAVNRLARRYADVSNEVLEQWPRDLSGRGNLTLETDLKWKDRETGLYKGSLKLDDLQTSLALTDVRGKINVRQLRLDFDQASAMLSAKGDIGTLSFDTRSTFAPREIVTDLTMDGSLKEFKSRFPRVLKRFIVDGEGRLIHHSEVRGKSRPDEPKTILGSVLGFINDHPADMGWRAWMDKEYNIAVDGRVQFRDAEMTFDTMPSYLRHITGTALYDLKHAWTPEPIPVEGGAGSRDLLGKIDMIYNGGTPPFILKFEITNGNFPADQWLRSWNLKKRKTAKEPEHPFDPNVPPFFSLRGDASTPSITYNNLQGTDFKAHYEFDLYRGQANAMSWSDCYARVNGGEILCKGTMQETSINISVQTKKMEMPPVVQAVTNKPNRSGMLTGKLTAQADFYKPRRQPAIQMRGQGTFRIEESRFFSNKILLSLGGVLKLPIFENISFSTIEGPFAVEGAKVSTTGVSFIGPIMNMNIVGSVGPDKQLDLEMQLQLLDIVRKLPLVGETVNLLNRLVKEVARFKVRGTMDDPKIDYL